MAGRVLPATFGPAGRKTKWTSRAAMALSRSWSASWRTASATIRNPLGAAVVPLATPSAAPFDTWAVFSETRRLCGSVPGANPVNIVWKSARSVQPAEWPRRRKMGGRGQRTDIAGHGTVDPEPGGQASTMVLEILAFHRCLRSVEAERTRGRDTPAVLFAPCFVLADGVGTALTLALSRAAVPFGQRNVCNALWAPPDLASRGLLRIEAYRFVSCGVLRANALVGPSPVYSRVGAVPAAGGCLPILIQQGDR